MNETQFQGKRALITGAAGGVGEALCRMFAARGAQVLGLDRNGPALDRRVRELGGAMLPIVADLAKPESLRRAVARAEKKAGAADILVNNAGFIRGVGVLRRMTPAVWRGEVEANLNGVFNIVHCVAPRMAARRGGVIVTVGSVNALAAMGHPGYSAAKAGLVNLTKALAMEYGGAGVRANIILPGTVATPAWRARARKDPSIFKRLQKWYPLGRIVEADEVARAACFLASDEASAISGAALPVDCGLTAGVLPFAEQLTLESFRPEGGK